jgi:hypothetical protein
MPEGADDTDSPAPNSPLEAVRFVGPATAVVLREADIAAAAFSGKRVSYRDLTDAGVNPGVAAKLRREHSLPWSFASDGEDLGRRSAQVRGLGDAERAWVAASSEEWGDGDTDTASDRSGEDGTDTGDWTPGGWPGQEADAQVTADGSGDSIAAEAAWQRRSAPEPTTALDRVDEAAAERLAEAGVRSVRSLATADPKRLADALDIDPERVSAWHAAARGRRA